MGELMGKKNGDIGNEPTTLGYPLTLESFLLRIFIALNSLRLSRYALLSVVSSTTSAEATACSLENKITQNPLTDNAAQNRRKKER